MDKDVEKEFVEVYKRMLDLRDDFSKVLKQLDELADRVILLEGK